MAGKKRAPCKTPECRERRRKAEARRKAFKQKRRSEAFMKPKRRKPGTTPKAKARKAKKAKKAKSKFFVLDCNLAQEPSECIRDDWKYAEPYASFTEARREAMNFGDDIDDDRYGLVLDEKRKVVFLPEWARASTEY